MEGFVYDDEPGIPPAEHKEPAELNYGDDPGPSGPRWRAVAVVLLVLAAGLLGLGIYAEHWTKSLWVRDVIISGNRFLDAGELQKKAEGVLGKNLEEVDGSVLSESYAALPYIRHAEVVKEMNGIVRVRVEERVPVAKIVSGGKVQVIDTEGYILPYRGIPRSSSILLRVAGMKATLVKGELLKKANEKNFTVLTEMVEALSASEYARLLIRDVFLKEENKTYFAVAGSPIRFIVGNDGNYKEKLKKFEIFWQKVVAKKGLDGYETVDLRFSNRVFAVESSRENFNRISP